MQTRKWRTKLQRFSRRYGWVAALGNMGSWGLWLVSAAINGGWISATLGIMAAVLSPLGAPGAILLGLLIWILAGVAKSIWSGETPKDILFRLNPPVVRKKLAATSPKNNPTPKPAKTEPVSSQKLAAPQLTLDSSREVGSVRILYHRRTGSSDVLHSEGDIKTAIVERDFSSVFILGPLVAKIVFHHAQGPFEARIDVLTLPFIGSIGIRTLENTERYLALSLDMQQIFVVLPEALEFILRIYRR